MDSRGGYRSTASALHPNRDQLYVVGPACVLALNSKTLTVMNEFSHGVQDANIRSAQVYESQLFVGLYQEPSTIRGAIIVLSLESGREGERLRTIKLIDYLRSFTIHQDRIITNLYYSSRREVSMRVPERHLFEFSMTGELISKQDPMPSSSGEFFGISSRGDEILIADSGRARIYTLRHAGVDGALAPNEFLEVEEPDPEPEDEELDESEVDSDDVEEPEPQED